MNAHMPSLELPNYNMIACMPSSKFPNCNTTTRTPSPKLPDYKTTTRMPLLELPECNAYAHTPLPKFSYNIAFANGSRKRKQILGTQKCKKSRYLEISSSLSSINFININLNSITQNNIRRRFGNSCI
jgi:hypothetical protein